MRRPLAAFAANLAVLAIAVVGQRDFLGAWAAWTPVAWAVTALLGLVLWRLDPEPSAIVEEKPRAPASGHAGWLQGVGLAASLVVLALGLHDLYLDLTSGRGAILWLAGLLGVVLSLAAPEWRPRLPAVSPRSLGITVVVAGALVLRLYGLATLPADVNNDEGEHADSGLNLVHGLPLYPGMPAQLASPFQTGWQTEPTGGHWLLGAVMRVAGEDVFGLRLTAALSGTACVWLVYALLRESARPFPAAAAALLLAVGHVHLFWSRTGFLQATVAALSTATVWLLLRGLRRGGAAAFAIAGLSLGLAQYVYWSARSLLAILAVFGLYLLLAQRTLLRRRFAGFGVMAVVFLLAIAPLALWTFGNPDTLLARGQRVFILANQAYVDGAYPGLSLPSVVAAQLGKSLTGFAVSGDGSRAFYRAAAPLLDPVTAALVLLGALGFTLEWRRPERVLVALWLWLPLLVFCGLTIDPPPTQRLLFMFPAFYVVAGAVLGRIGALAERAGKAPRRLWLVLVACMLLYAANWNYRVFFVDYAAQWPARTWTSIGRLLRQAGPSHKAYLVARPQLYANNSTIRFLARGVPATDVLVDEIPIQERGERDGIFIVSPLAAPQALPRLRQVYANSRAEQQRDAKGQVIYTAVRVDKEELNRAAAPTAPRRTIEQRFGLIGRGFGELRGPRGIAVGADGRVYVADTGNDRIVVYGADGTPEAHLTGGGALKAPWSLALAANGDILVIERGPKRLRRLSPRGELLADMPVAIKGDPAALAVLADGTVLLVDMHLHQVALLPPGGGEGRVFGGRGSGPGRFERPGAVAVGADGTIYVAELGENKRVQRFSRDLEYLGEWPLPPMANRVAALAAAPGGGVWVLHPGIGAAHLYTPEGEERLSVGAEGDEPHELVLPGGIALGPSGDIFILDLTRAQVWQYRP